VSKLSLGVENAAETARGESGLVALGEAERMLAAAVSLDEIRGVLTLAETARQFARSAHLGLHAQNHAAGISLEAQAKADAALKEARARGDLARQGSNQNSTETSIVPTLSDIDVTWDEAAAWAKVGAVSPEARAAYVIAATEAKEEASRAGLLKWQPATGLMSSDSPEWYTPPHIIAAVVVALGAIDLDPCADPGCTVPAGTHFTEEDDGLSRDWSGHVYMNPPYGPAIPVWVAKLVAEVEAKRVTAAVALIPARTETDWWASFDARTVCFIHGRLAFSGQGAAPFPSAVIYLGQDDATFVKAFAALGEVYRRVT
jgi:phage N-6-adenine-methyltransferase